jgi:hypothetical protein
MCGVRLLYLRRSVIVYQEAEKGKGPGLLLALCWSDGPAEAGLYLRN